MSPILSLLAFFIGFYFLMCLFGRMCYEEGMNDDSDDDDDYV